MTDREKIIKGLECCTTPGNCGTCPWQPSEDAKEGCIRTLMKATLKLLKAQEPSDDWISRKRLKNEIQYYIEEAGWGEEINKALGWCLEFIDNQEAVKWE